MVIAVDSGEITFGKRAEAIDILKRWAAAAPSAKAEVLTSESGTMDKIVLVRHYESHETRLREDKEWHKSPERAALMEEIMEKHPWGKRTRTFYVVE